MSGFLVTVVVVVVVLVVMGKVRKIHECSFRWVETTNYIIVGLGWWFGFLESPYEMDCYLGVPLESQTTNPNQQLNAINH